jgi:hypothetical protein
MRLGHRTDGDEQQNRAGNHAPQRARPHITSGDGCVNAHALI